MNDASDGTGLPLPEAILRAELEEATREHFQMCRERVPALYAEHFASLRGVARRHLRCWLDLPHDLLSIPRMIWGWVRPGKRKPAPLSRKELEVLQLLRDELLDLDEWIHCLGRHTRQLGEKSTSPDHARALQQAAENYLRQELIRISLPREGSRDLVVFVLIGVAGQTLSDSITFGSALALGTALLSSWYLSTLPWWQRWWESWMGLPDWLMVGGATLGILGAIVIAPLIAPFTEWLVHRMRGPRFLAQWIDAIENQALRPKRDVVDRASPVASMAQLIPDLISLLKQIR